jgi:alpha-beta hydrolase superfamily lysophospholipase
VTELAEEFETIAANGRPIRGDAWIVPNADAAIVLCHGFKGFARWGFFPWLAGQMADAGFTTIAFDFSGSGVGPDRQSFSELEAFADQTFSEGVDDLDRVMHEARARGWLTRRVGLFGFSRGGGIAVLGAARDPRIDALVTWSSISTVKRWSAAEIAEWRSRGHAETRNARTGQVFRVSTAILDDVEAHGDGSLSIPDAAARIRVPWLIVHGDADETVPVAEAHTLYGLSRYNADLRLVPGATHTYGATHGMQTPPPAIAQVATWTTEFFRTALA